MVGCEVPGSTDNEQLIDSNSSAGNDNNGDNGDNGNAEPSETPVARNIQANLELDVRLPIRLQAVDPEGQDLSYSIVTPPQSGTLLGTAPELFYVPNDVQFTGDDSFTYTASDGWSTSEVATVDIHVREQEIDSDDLGGALADLLVHVPNHLLYKDLGSNDLNIDVETSDDLTEPFLRRTDFTNKTMTIDLGSIDLSPPFSISLKWIPEGNNTSSTILSSGSLTIKETSGSLVTEIGASSTTHPAQPHTHSTNHVVVSVENTVVKTYVNGVYAEETVDNRQQRLTGSLEIGPFPGRVWDVRVYDDATSVAEADLGAEDTTGVLAEPYFQGEADNLPLYRCGVYMCLWYNEDDGLTEQELDEFLWAQDGFYEHNVLVIGMHPHGKIGQDFKDGRPGWTWEAKWRDIPLSTERWIAYAQLNGDYYDDAYWVHEDFHQYQTAELSNSRVLAESTAEWSVLEYDPDNLGLWIQGEYTFDTHLPFWISGDHDQTGYSTWRGEGGEGGGSNNNGGHMYGLSVFQTYVTSEVLGPKYIGDVYNDFGDTTESIYQVLDEHGVDMRVMFRDFAARTVTFDYDQYGEVLRQNDEQCLEAMDRNSALALTPDSKFAAVFGSEGSGVSLQSPPSGQRPGSWAFNAYKVNAALGNYSISVVPGDNPEWAEFQAMAVLYDPETGNRTYYEFDNGLQEGVSVDASGEELYLVVATTPSQRFEGFEQYDYQYRITRN